MIPRIARTAPRVVQALFVSLPLLAGCAYSPRSEMPPALQAYEDHARAVAVAFRVAEFHATNGLTYRAEGASLDDALLQSASHDLGCPRDAVRSVAWVAPSRTTEHAYDGCGKRAVYRTAIYAGRSETQGREDVILAGLFAVPD
ncbi:MAG TPA: hypothetical protein VGG39_33170 [Polyangiaceae bacterium]|jgi:hypothetical protein